MIVITYVYVYDINYQYIPTLIDIIINVYVTDRAIAVSTPGNTPVHSFRQRLRGNKGKCIIYNCSPE